MYQTLENIEFILFLLLLISLIFTFFISLKKLFKFNTQFSLKKCFITNFLFFIILIIFSTIFEINKERFLKVYNVNEFDFSEYSTTIDDDDLYVPEATYKILYTKNNHPFTGIITVNFEDKLWKKAYIYNGNIKKYQVFYNGILETEYPVKNNTIEGTVISYFKNSKVKSKTEYINNFPEGKYIEYNSNGKLIKNIIISNGKEYSEEEYSKLKKFEKIKSTNKKNNFSKEKEEIKDFKKNIKNKLNYNELTLGKDNLYYIFSDNTAGNLEKKLATGKIDYNKESNNQIQLIKATLVQGKFIDYTEKRNYVVLDKNTNLISIPLGKPFIYKKESFENDKKNGDFVNLIDSGFLISGYNSYNNLNGIFITQERGTFKTGKKEGEFTTIKTLFNISNKKVIDTFEIIKWKGFYQNGNLHGTVISYYDNGQIQFSKEYNNGILNGIIKYYYSNGKLKSIGEYKNGKPINLYEVYSSEGKILETTNYTTGETKKLNSDNQIIKEGNFINGTLKELKDGKIFITTFKNGKKNGECLIVQYNCKIKGFYSNDKPSGTWIWLDSNGNIIKTKTY